TNKDLCGIRLSKFTPFINSIAIIKEKKLQYHLLKKQTKGFGHIHFHSENDAAIFYNCVKDRPFPDGPENIEIQFLPSKDENDEHITYNISNHEENFLQNNNDENYIYELPDNSNKRNKRSKDKALNETDDNSKKSKRSEDKILNRTDSYELLNFNKETREILNPQYALYENR
ncbi:36327_t:CDS:2, partial [Racocetra persica]